MAEVVIDLQEKRDLLLLGGVPRSGKTLLSKDLWLQHGIPGFAMDVMVSTFMHLGADDVLNFQDSDDRTQKVAIAADRVAWAGLHMFDRYFIEGESVTPAVADALRSRYNVTACFLVMHKPRLNDIIEHEGHDPWVKDVSTEEQLAVVAELARRSHRMQADAERYGFPCIDMSAGDYRERTREALRTYSDAGLTFSGSMP